METLKTVIADKILDISSGNNDDMRVRLDKVSRFRDFTNALAALMDKYPLIEQELIRMVKNDDFDTKVAASRVDTIIRLSENKQDEAGFVLEDEIINIEPVEIEDNIQSDDIVIPEPVIINNEPIREKRSGKEVAFLKKVFEKENLKKVALVTGIIVAIVAIIFIVSFVIKNWKVILYILGGASALTIAGWILYKKYKKKNV